MRHVLFCLIPIAVLAACQTPAHVDHWQRIDAPALVFTGVALPDAAFDPGWPEVCREAAKEITAQLRRRLPARLHPVRLEAAPTPAGKPATLTVRIERCALDVDQWGDSFDFFLDLDLRLQLNPGRRKPLAWRIRTAERARSDTPSPAWIFTFADPVRRILSRFAAGRVAVPVAAQRD